MQNWDVVIDTNVIVSGLRSNLGASFKLLQLIGRGYFNLQLSVPLILEYEDVLYRLENELAITKQDIDNFLDYICLVSTSHEIHYLWRPTLRDPNDEMLLELAVKARCNYIITFNKRDFKDVEKFGLKLVTPSEFLNIVR